MSKSHVRSITMFRHARSRYNDVTKSKNELPEYQEFRDAFDASYFADAATEEVRADLFERVLREQWPTPDLRELGLIAQLKIHELMQGVSDFDTPITELGELQADQLGENSHDLPVPDVIYSSPYLRPCQTRDRVLAKRADLASVSSRLDPNLREQEHGKASVYNDWRYYFVKHPDEALLYNKDPFGYQYDGGENTWQTMSRGSRFMGHIHRLHANEDVWVFTHHLLKLGIRAELEHWDRGRFIEVNSEQRPANCSITTYELNPSSSASGGPIMECTRYNEILYSCAQE